ncbi:MAG: fibronectin type III domain-containing protein [Nitrospiria bacterium]
MITSKIKTLLHGQWRWGARSLLIFWLILTGVSLSAHASVIGSGVQVDNLAGADDNASISFDGTNYLVAWQTSTTTSTSNDIYGNIIDSNGNSIVPAFAINAGLNDQTFPSIANFGANKFLVVYQNFNGTDQDIVGTFVSYSTTSATSGTAFVIAGGAGNQQYPSVAYDGSAGFYVTYVDNGTAVKAVSVSNTGAVGTPVTLGAVTSNSAAPSVLPQIAFSNAVIGKYLVGWEDFTSTTDPSGNIYANTITTAGTAGSAVGIAVTANFAERHPSLAFDGSNFLVVYDAGSAGSKDIYGQLVTPNLVLSGVSFPVSTAMNDQVAPKLSFSAGANFYFASWQDYRNSMTNADIYGARIPKTGGVIEPSGLALMTNPTFQKQNPVSGNDGTNYFAVWTDFRNPPTGSDLWGQKAAGPPSLLSAVTPGANLTVGASVTLTGNYFGDLPSGSRSTATDYVLINGIKVPDSNFSSWTNISIAFTLPANSGSGPVQVYSGNLGSNTLSITTQDFSLISTPASLATGQGGTGNYTLTLTALNGFSSPVTLSVSNLPSGVSASFSANPVTPASTGTSSTLTLAVSLAALPGTYTFQAAGTGGGETHTVPLTLNVAALPAVMTSPATSITKSSATLNGTVNPNGQADAAWFDYGITTSYGSATPSFSLTAGYTQTTLSSAITGLSMGTTYHFRMTSKNSLGTAYGGDQSFITIANPSVAVTGVASNKTTTSITLNGTANPNGVPGSAWFDYGLSLNYGNSTMPLSISGNFDNFVSTNVFGLSPYSVYHFRMVASNNGGTSYGMDQTFNTYTIPNYGQPVIELAASPVTLFNGINSSDFAGTSVSNGGDVNGDGIKDLIICADNVTAPANSTYPGGRTGAGACYLFFGKPPGWPSPTILSQADLTIYGINPNDMLGHSVSIAGDLNADGFADIVIGAPQASPVYKTATKFQAGQVYIIKGRANFYKDYPTGIIDLSVQAADVTISGANDGDTIGDAVTTAGDINGDFISDLVFSAPKIRANNVAQSGQIYIVFGKASLPPLIDLSSTATGGNADVVINGFTTNGLSSAISISGDVNGDGKNDLLVGVEGYSPTTKSTGQTRFQAGGAFLFYGQSNWPSVMDLGYANLTLNGIHSGDMAGSAVSLGDLNKDGKADIIIGASLASPNALANSGSVYLVLGKSSYCPNSSCVVELSNADATMNGAGAGDQLGRALSSKSDLNGDGYPDLLIGAPSASPGGRTNAGSVYVVLGKALFPSVINLATGYDTVINGANTGDFAGGAIDGSGDINGDLLPDIIIGANLASPALKTYPFINAFAGQAYVIFGNNQYDTVPPSIPSGLTVVLTSDSQIGLSWTASTDNVAVAGYEVYRNGTKVATVGGTAFTDSGLRPLTQYNYQVLAFDLAGNKSSLSAGLKVSTLADTVPPTPPSGLTATAVSPSQINLSWMPGSDDIGVAGYEVWRSTDGALYIHIANVTGTAFSSAGLSPSSVNYYYVKTYDAAGNSSIPSNVASAVTLADTVPPSAPLGLHAVTVSGSEIDLWWFDSVDNVGVAGYQIWRSTDNLNFTRFATSTTSGYADKGLTTIQTYYYYVKAYDVSGNISGPSGTAYAVNDIIPPTAPASISGTVVSPGQINLSWTASTDNSGVINGYQIYSSTNNVTFTLAGIVGGNILTFSNTGLLANTSYYYYVKAYDLAGNLSTASPTGGPYTTPLDTIPPTTPTGLAVSGFTVTTVSLTWIASTDNSGTIASYQVWRALGTSACSSPPSSPFSQAGSSTATSYTDSPLSPGATYSYCVVAVDSSSNKSGASNTVTQTTLADTTAPSAPTNVSGAAVSETQINLSWAPSVDNVGVAGYQILRSTTSTAVFTTTSTGFSDTGLLAGTTYSYTIRAFDTSGNYSTASPPFSMTTLDQTKPYWPAGSTFSATTAAGSAGASQINLSWSQAADNGHGVAGYTIWRSSNNISFAQINSQLGAVNTTFSSTGLQPSTTYYYYIIAFDAMGNSSVPSTTFSATTTVDTTPPTAPGSLTVIAVGDSKLGLSWTVSTDNVAVAGYSIYRSTASTGPFITIGTSPVNSYTDSLNLAPSTPYYYYVIAFDYAGNQSTASATASGTTFADSTPPTVPRGLVAFTASNQTQVNLNWIPSTDNSGTVSGYKIYRNGLYAGTALSNSYSDLGLIANQTYIYTITAYDPYGNVSALSAPVTAVTDVYPPTIPCANLASPCSSTGAPYGIAAGSSEIDIAWSASADIDLSNGGQGSGVAGYKVYRSDLTSPIGTTIAGTTIFADKGLVPKTTYNYRISAFDKAGNESSQSTPVAVTTPADTTPPSVPANLTASLAAPYQINLTWAPSTDNDRVAGYKIYRNGTLETYTTSTSFADQGLNPGTTYTYTVSAYDRSGNQSGQSNPASATTSP